MQFIDHKQVESVLRMEDLIPLMRQTMIDFSLKKIEQPTRRILSVAEHEGYFGSMPAISTDAVGAKLVAFYPDNDEKGLPTHMANIVLFKPETGEPLAVMDGALITEMRTAAVSAVFIDTFAAKNVKSLAILGAGVQAASHIEALSLIRDFEDIRICNRNIQRAEELAEKTGAHVMNSEDAVRDADVVVAATASSEPVIKGECLKGDAKVVSVGWAGADGGELDAQTMANIVLVDSREGAEIESGNVRRNNAQIYAELGEVLAGEISVDKKKIVVFESIGMACQDLSSASLVLDKLSQQTNL
ncbi:MAG: ornithine cyclodeaminase family protein [Gammaproteobacteria bacterium]|nr:ornithine cyclodeaminase family protein [Gammaproteobacteria bacterium]